MSTLTPDVHASAGSSPDETEGIITFTAQDILLGVPAAQRRSWRDPRQPAPALISARWRRRFGGGGHMNASGFTSTDSIESVRATLLPLLRYALQVIPALDGVLIVDKPGKA